MKYAVPLSAYRWHIRPMIWLHRLKLDLRIRMISWAIRLRTAIIGKENVDN
jgi:hypothetical protein